MSITDDNSDKDFASFLRGDGPSADLSDLILQQVLTTVKRRKTRDRKVAVVISIYIGLMLSALLLLFFMSSASGLLSTLKFPDFRSLSVGNHELAFYSKLAIITFLFSCIAFGVFMAKPKSIMHS